ncbi:ShlB/FhaC/HecB family hemolysin secretion/activation protein [Herbaspirillum sp. RTI4]|nr:ShlB/FhaC/HecB family hemolysin secretion/activation protein [Herbaspirillum sp. RTI4]MDY7578469.1 ShlB/FhaC/HecB family hemolysin secretion/activation protein [Herbaspirillum sp. RTI4]MEA9981502.1 ShlB/FhaC/HecB family hemolysin secretion/activation protein [Herbaspirillum sp. RTI4]
MLVTGIAGLVFLAATPAMAASDDHFDILRFQIDGNTLLPDEQVQRLLAPLVGRGRVYGDVQKALEALELAYRQAGFSTVQVYVPEQELTGGVVLIHVTESKIGTVTVTGNQYFSEANIRASLPFLAVGTMPNLREISESIQLANDNPAKQVAVTLGAADEGDDAKIDAKVVVTDSNPLRIFTTLDNTGSPATGQWRTGIALQHSNLFNSDQVGTLAYTLSPDSPKGVSVALYSLGYRIPIYTFGDSLDFVYGKSSVNTPSSSPTLGGSLGILGKGDVLGARWNHFFARQGEGSSKLVTSIDYKKIDSRCDINGVDLASVGLAPGPCLPYTVRPIGLTYIAQSQGVNEASDYSIGLSRNIPIGTTHVNTDGTVDRYSFLTPGNRRTVDAFMVLRGGGSWFKGLTGGWQARLAFNAQYTNTPLLSGEQFGMAGANSVRGFGERAVAADSGMIVNAEFYTPELAGENKFPGNLRFLTFVDVGRGYNNHVGSSGVPDQVTVASTGVGMRFAVGRTFNLKLDVARVANPGTSVADKRGDWTAHLSAMLGF